MQIFDSSYKLSDFSFYILLVFYIKIQTRNNLKPIEGRNLIIIKQFYLNAQFRQ